MKQKTTLLLLLAILATVPMFLFAQSLRDFDYYLQKGNNFLSDKNGKEALPMFDSAIFFRPKSPDAYVGRGNAKVRDFSLEDGLKDFDTAILFADKKDKLRYYELKEEKVSDKVKFLFIASKGPAPSSELVTHHGKQYDKITEQYKLDMFNRAIKLFPDSAKAYIDRSNYYYTKSMFKEAIEDAKKAIKKEHSPESYFNLGGIMRSSSSTMFKESIPNKEISKIHSNEEILKVFDEDVRYNPNNPKSYEDRAAFERCLFLVDNAKEDYNKAEKLRVNSK